MTALLLLARFVLVVLAGALHGFRWAARKTENGIRHLDAKLVDRGRV